MARFIMVYRGPATPMEEMTPEMGAEQMRAWGLWMDKAGPALADGGAPFGARASVLGDGSSGAPADLNGYTIVEADDLAAAQALCDGHPFLSTGEAKFAVDLFELVPVEM